MMEKTATTAPHLRTVLIIAIVLAGLVGGGILLALTTGRNDMRTKSPTAETTATIPPIDAAAPSTFETATFALG